MLFSKFYTCSLIQYLFVQEPGDFQLYQVEPYEIAAFVSLKYSNFNNVLCFNLEIASELMVNNIQWNYSDLSLFNLRI